MTTSYQREGEAHASASLRRTLSIYFNRLLVVGGVVGIAYLGESGHDGGFIKDVWNAAKTASPFAAMFAVMAWLKADQERKDAQTQLYERTISFVEAANKQSAAVESMVTSIKKISELISTRGRRR